MPTLSKTIAPKLVRWYLHHGMPDRLAEAVLVCRYLEAILEDVPPGQTGRIAPIFDHPLEDLRADWLACRWHELWLDDAGWIVNTLPPGDGEPDTTHTHLDRATQASILFGRFAHLFQ